MLLWPDSGDKCDGIAFSMCNCSKYCCWWSQLSSWASCVEWNFAVWIVCALRRKCNWLTCGLPGAIHFPLSISLIRFMANSNFFWWPNLTMPISSISSHGNWVTSRTCRYPWAKSGWIYSSKRNKRNHSSIEPWMNGNNVIESKVSK